MSYRTGRLAESASQGSTQDNSNQSASQGIDQGGHRGLLQPGEFGLDFSSTD